MQSHTPLYVLQDMLPKNLLGVQEESWGDTKGCPQGTLGCLCRWGVQEVCDKDQLAYTPTLQGIAGSSTGCLRFQCWLQTMDSMRCEYLPPCCPLRWCSTASEQVHVYLGRFLHRELETFIDLSGPTFPKRMLVNAKLLHYTKNVKLFVLNVNNSAGRKCY